MMNEYIYADDNPLMPLLYFPFRIDVSRFGLDDKFFADMHGSSSGNQMAAQITINFDSSNGIYGQKVSASYVNGAYTMRLFTESVSQAACENGLYKNVA
jgi:hypothetical protein